MTLSVRRLPRASILAATAAALSLFAIPVPSSGTQTPTAKIIVQGTSDVRDAVVRMGGHITHDLPIIGGFSARVPAYDVPAIAQLPGVRNITPDGSTHVQSAPLPATSPNTRPSVFRTVTNADKLNKSGGNGQGVTVALIDTGVTALPDVANAIVPVTNSPLGLTGAQPCVNLTAESTCDDTFGHGTFMAGIIAGNGSASGGVYSGAAPRARILSIKVAGASGACDVSTIIAALQWVVLNQATYNIRVLNLSLGTDSTQSYTIDPLDFAVEKAWQAGITVNVAAANRGPSAGTIDDPANDPFVITVGAMDDMGTNGTGDDQLPAFTSRGPTASDGLAKPDLVAPGAHVVSLAAPNATLTTTFPSSMAAPYRRGSGTSMANAVVSGVEADMLSLNPALTPDRIKFMLKSTAHPYSWADPMAVGAGMVDGTAAMSALPGLANQGVAPSLGTGSIQAARGTVSFTLYDADGTVLDATNCLTVFLTCPDFTSGTWFGGNWTGGNWTGGNWTGGNWTGGNWTGGNWTGGNWTGGNWTGGNWTGGNWTGGNWTGGNWTDANWQGTDEPQPDGYGGIMTGSEWYGAWDL